MARNCSILAFLLFLLPLTAEQDTSSKNLVFEFETSLETSREDVFSTIGVKYYVILPNGKVIVAKPETVTSPKSRITRRRKTYLTLKKQKTVPGRYVIVAEMISGNGITSSKPSQNYIKASLSSPYTDHFFQINLHSQYLPSLIGNKYSKIWEIDDP